MDSKSHPPVFKILNGSYKGKQFRLLSSKITMGKHSDCDVIFKDNPKCSLFHAKIEKKEDFYFIESLDSKNPVFVNKKSVTSHLLRSKDKVLIGSVEMLFVEKAPLPSPLQKPFLKTKLSKSRSWAQAPRIFFIFILLGLGVLVLTQKKSIDTNPQSLRTESDILKDVEDLQALNEEEIQKQNLTSEEKTARTLFIKGFRDYRKGYFSRALKLFQQCLTIQQKNLLCKSYVNKSKIHIDKLIQKKIRLGKIYKFKKQYRACQATFESVEIMLQDPSNPVFKEARENKKLCETKLQNKI